MTPIDVLQHEVVLGNIDFILLSSQAARVQEEVNISKFPAIPTPVLGDERGHHVGPIGISLGNDDLIRVVHSDVLVPTLTIDHVHLPSPTVPVHVPVEAVIERHHFKLEKLHRPPPGFHVEMLEAGEVWLGARKGQRLDVHQAGLCVIVQYLQEGHLQYMSAFAVGNLRDVRVNVELIKKYL